MLIERLKDDRIYRIAIPVPFPMKYVYCYLLKNESGYTLVDTGLNYKNARAAWEEVFVRLQIQSKEIHTIILTHFHPDHSGMAGWMQQKTGATVWMSETDINMFELAFQKQEQLANVDGLLAENGVGKELREAIQGNLSMITKNVQPFAEIKPIADKNWNLDGRLWDIIATPGHSEGHLCFYQKEEQILLAGDMILDKITPNISLWPGGSKTPLQDYLSSLNKLKDYKVAEAWTGHGEVIRDVPKRLQELIDHHKERLERIKNLAINKSGFAITEELFAERELNAHQWRFAISETLAHLEYLVDSGDLQRTDSTPHLYTKQVANIYSPQGE